MQLRHAIEPLSKQVTIVIGLTVVGFMTFGLTLSFYRNIMFERTLEQLAEENRLIAQGIDDGYQDLEYYRSRQYRDKFAKENLSRLNPGEQVIIINQAATTTHPLEEAGEARQERTDAAWQELLHQMPVKEHWYLYLFRQEKVAQLRATLQ